jgi:predicted O-methyltransferase YrrM
MTRSSARSVSVDVEASTALTVPTGSVRSAAVKARLASLLARSAAAIPSHTFRRRLVEEVLERDPHAILQPVGVAQNRAPRLATMPLDLDPNGELEFEDLAGLFASSMLNHGVIGMTIRQTAYVFGLARRSGAKRAIEIGRWRGGSTIVLAAGMGPGGRVWSIDIGEKAERLLGVPGADVDAETAEFCRRFGLDVELLVGDSRTIEVDTGEVDIALIDGDHTYEGVRADVERFGPRLRIGGALLIDDVYDDFFVPSHPESAGRLVRELEAGGDYRVVKGVDRLAHLERVR